MVIPTFNMKDTALMAATPHESSEMVKSCSLSEIGRSFLPLDGCGEQFNVPEQESVAKEESG